MKNAIFFVLVLFVFSACQNIEQYKTGVEELTTKWEATNTNINDFVNQLQTEANSNAAMLSQMEMEVSMFSSLSADAQIAVTEAKTSCSKVGNDYSTMQEEVTNFMAEWTSKQAELDALKEAIAQEELNGNMGNTIVELNTFVTDAEATLATWMSNFAEAKSTCDTSHSNYSRVLAQLTTAK